MTLAHVEGQTRAIEALRSALKSGSVHHAYLFGGPDGVGKELAAVGLAQALMCERPTEQADACGQCDGCRRVEKRNHPDLTWLMPEAEQVERGLAGRADFDHTPSREIRVEQVRALQERLSLRALEAPHKVAVILEAQAMNPQAQNAFLKTLEEPPSRTVLVLVASAPDKLMPTIRSRCSRVQFGPLPESLLTTRLSKERKLDEPAARLVAIMAGGSLGRAMELDVDGLAKRRSLIERFEALSPTDSREWLRLAEELADTREVALEALEVLALWTRDLCIAQAGSSAIAHGDLLELAQRRSKQLDPAALHRRRQLLEEAHTAIGARNGGARLQLERMLIELHSSAR